MSVFSSVSAPPPSRPPHSLTHSLTHARTHSLTHTRTHTHTPLTHSLTHSFTHALAFLGLRRSAGGFCVAGAALGALQGVGCTPWRPLVSGGFCVAAAALGALQGVGCTPWRPLVSAALPVAFAWQARHLVLCKGSDVRPRVPSLTHSLTHILIHSPDSPTITPPSLLYFLFPSCFSMLSLSLEKLVTCGVIRSYNFVCLAEGNPTFFGPRRPFRPRTPLSWRSPSPLSPWLGPWSRPEEKRRLFLWGYVYVYIYIRMYMYIYIYVCICIYIYTYVYIYIYTYVCVYIYIYVCVYIYIYVCI